ncbi:MAG: hypothetical protein Q7V19_18820, partial [Bacteroidales bacterium]|nr:hypothetical protein [Bacteroidales bacterium]
LISAAFAATMQFFVFYSQLARPYAPGMFFVLFAVFWLSVMQVCDQKVKNKHLLLYSVSLAMATYMHYFSMMLAGLIFLSGFFIVENQNFKKYFLSGLLALLLYAPHFPIFWFQIKAGGIGGWLGAPEPDFLLDFFAYTFHFSLIFGLTALMIAAVFFNRNELTLLKNKRRLIGFLWFGLSFLIAYFYSVYRTPILQFSTLYFSFPFLMLVFFSFTKPLKGWQNLLMAAIVLIIGSFTLIGKRSHYDLMYHQGYDQAALLMAEDKAEFGKNIAFAAIGGSAEMFGFYMDKQQLADVKLMNLRSNPSEFWDFLDNTDREYFGIAWADYAPYEWIESARSRFEIVLNHKSWFNSEYYLLKRASDRGKWLLLAEERTLLDEGFDKSGISFDKDNVYGMLWEAAGDTLMQATDNMIVTSLLAMAVDTVRAVRLVLEFKADDGSQLHWMAGNLHGKVVLPGEHFWLHAAYRFDAGSENVKTALMRSYVWNQGNERFMVQRRLIYSRPHDPILLGLYAAVK